MTRQRLDVRAAASELGISVEAVRKRIERGSLDSEKGEDGRVYVYLDIDQTEPDVEGFVTAPLVEELRDRVRSLERMLEAEREARTEERRRHDTLMARLMDRIPELEPGAPPADRPEPPGEPQDAPRTGHEGAGRVDISQDQTRPGEDDSGPLWHSREEAPEDLPRRPWWRRWFG